MSDARATRQELAAVLDTAQAREVRARRAAEIVCEAGHFDWVGIYDVDDETMTPLGHTGPQARAFASFDGTRGFFAVAIETRSTVFTEREAVVPIPGAETGIAIGILFVEGEDLGDAERTFAEDCAVALMPLFE
jgi:hypothetical protein